MDTHTPSDREQALIRLVNRYETDLLRLCCVCLGDIHLAQDAVQETFFKAYRHLDRFREESSEKTWLTRIAINTCRDMKRQGWFRHIDRSVTPDMLPEPACSQEQSDLVMDIMNLPLPLREVILLYYYQEMTMKEISFVLRIPQRTVSFRLQKARQILRIELEKEGLHETKT